MINGIALTLLILVEVGIIAYIITHPMEDQ